MMLGGRRNTDTHTWLTRDACVLTMAAVVYAPPIERTTPQLGLIPSTPHIVHPDLTCALAKVGIPTGKGERKLTICIHTTIVYSV